jgi:hypothetical protein
MQRASPLAREALVSAAAAGAFAALLAWTAPPGTDLAAHVYQRALFLDHGFTLWNNFWYAGRYSFVTYSLIYYPLAAALGIRLLAVATIASAALAFAVLVLREWGPRARWSSRTFAVVWAGIVLSAAFPFALGAALALLALWALQARRPWRFAGLAALAAAASPLAFLLLALVVVGIAIGRRSERRLRTATAAALLAVGGAELVLWRAFPDSGSYPFSAAELAAACTFCTLATALTWRVDRARALRFVFPVYGTACLAFFVVHSAVGENVARLRYLAIPLTVLVLSLREWRPRPVAVVVLGLAIAWNVTPLAASFARASDDPAAHAAYWQPAIGYLRAHLTPSYRVEAVDTAGHWAALYLPEGNIPLARGWFRQDDFPLNEVLYGDLGPRAYLTWLRSLGVRYVLLTTAAPDYSARAEAALVGGPRSPLKRVFRTAQLAVYEVPHPRPLITGPGPARISAMSEDRIAVRVSRPGTYRIAVRFSRYWHPTAGCAVRGPDGMIRLSVPRSGAVRLHFDADPGRALAALAGQAARACAG